MGSKTLFYQFKSDKSVEDVKQAAMRAFMPLGGQVVPFGNGLQVIQGKAGVQFGFAADFNAMLNILKQDDRYDLSLTIDWKMNTTSIICLIVGVFVLGILWIVPLLYLFIDPGQSYQQALNSIPIILGS